MTLLPALPKHANVMLAALCAFAALSLVFKALPSRQPKLRMQGATC